MKNNDEKNSTLFWVIHLVSWFIVYLTFIAGSSLDDTGFKGLMGGVISFFCAFPLTVIINAIIHLLFIK